jgi:hypothetical protein
MEKRLGIAQLCLLLAVLVFLSVTRGSPGEFHIPRVNSHADSMGEWGRRGLRLSSAWVPSRLRRGSSGPPSAPNGLKTPTRLMPRSPAWEPVLATAPVIPTSRAMVLPLLSAPTTTNTTTPTFRKKLQTVNLTPLHPLSPPTLSQTALAKHARESGARLAYTCLPPTLKLTSWHFVDRSHIALC